MTVTDQILEELKAREPIFHRPEFGTTRADFAAMMADGFFEIGASGRRYGREDVLDALEKRHAQAHEDVWEATDFSCRELAPGLYLLTYRLLQDGVRKTRRTTIWRRDGSAWRIVFHQGTLVQD